jgi:hypothetical protein
VAGDLRRRIRYPINPRAGAIEVDVVCCPPLGDTLAIKRTPRYAQVMTEPVPAPIELPAKSPEELAEIRALHERIRQGDFTGTVEWEEVAAELGLPSAAHRAGPSPAP